jgi:poly(3-hydroxyoctanoate) depolymerase
MTFSSLPWLHTLPHQTLVLSGADDPIVPSINGAILAHLIPNARHHVIRRGGHLFILDSPDQVAPIVEEFLANTELRDHVAGRHQRG